ncbi:MAG: hypothetical protein IJ587_09520 [Synergistaceae bacterium]|nr:hypothetical protein [Synergistaceae bacterium]
MITADEALHDLTLALIYLSRQSDSKKTLWDVTTFSAWKNYEWNVLDQLDEEGFVYDKHGRKAVYISEKGVLKAHEILEKLGIADWEEKNVK